MGSASFSALAVLGVALLVIGRVDEMHRSLGLYAAVKVEEADRARVWGES